MQRDTDVGSEKSTDSRIKERLKGRDCSVRWIHRTGVNVMFYSQLVQWISFLPVPVSLHSLIPNFQSQGQKANMFTHKLVRGAVPLPADGLQLLWCQFDLSTSKAGQASVPACCSCRATSLLHAGWGMERRERQLPWLLYFLFLFEAWSLQES